MNEGPTPGRSRADAPQDGPVGRPPVRGRQALAVSPDSSSHAFSASIPMRTTCPSARISSSRGSDTTQTREPDSVSISYSTVSP